jgi:hypothetical protein
MVCMSSETNKRRRQEAGQSTGGQFASDSKPESAITLLAGSEPVQLAGSSVPEYCPEALTHIGSLDPSAKGSWSLEGRGLSVSRHPEAWGRIAGLGGPVWSVGSAAPRFLDYHELTPEQRQAITDWGVKRGYVEVKPAWKVTTFDDEYNDYRWTVYLDEADAEEEAEFSEGTVDRTTSVISTMAFPDPTVKAGEPDVEEILATVWVEQEAEAFDGVWWEDDYNPEQLSAPRGVIVPRAIEEWVASAVPFDGDGSDEEDEDCDE